MWWIAPGILNYIQRIFRGTVSVQDRVFVRAIAVVLGALVLFTVTIAIFANRISAPDPAYTDPIAQAKLVERVRPVGMSRIER